jgi:hypothetical protein
MESNSLVAKKNYNNSQHLVGDKKISVVVARYNPLKLLIMDVLLTSAAFLTALQREQEPLLPAASEVVPLAFVAPLVAAFRIETSYPLVLIYIRALFQHKKD